MCPSDQRLLVSGRTRGIHIAPHFRNSSESNKIFGSNNNAEDGGGGSGQANAETGDGQRERGKAYDDESEETKYR